MDTSQLHELASNALAEGDFEKAEKCYQEILTEVPNDEAALTSLMDIYEKTDKLKYYLARANYNIVNGKIEYGINDCKKALSLDESNIVAREKLARLYRISNKNLKAIDEFTKIIEINPNHMQSYIELIDLYSREQSEDSAIDIAIKASERFKGQFNFNDMLAKLYFDIGEYKKALEVVGDTVLKIKILLQDEQNDAAKKILDHYSPDKLEKEQKAMYFLLMAQYHYNVNEYDLAFEYIDQYTQIMGPNALSFQMKALCYDGKNDDFMASYNYAYMNKALNKFDDALVEFTHAYSLNPNNKDVLIELAKLYEQNNEKYTAIDFWHKVYDLDQDETARSILADFYIKEGDMSMAEQFGANSGKGDNSSKGDDEPVEEDEGLLNKLINLFSKK